MVDGVCVSECFPFSLHTHPHPPMNTCQSPSFFLMVYPCLMGQDTARDMGCVMRTRRIVGRWAFRILRIHPFGPTLVNAFVWRGQGEYV